MWRFIGSVIGAAFSAAGRTVVAGPGGDTGGDHLSGLDPLPWGPGGDTGGDTGGNHPSGLDPLNIASSVVISGQYSTSSAVAPDAHLYAHGLCT